VMKGYANNSSVIHVIVDALMLIRIIKVGISNSVNTPNIGNRTLKPFLGLNTAFLKIKKASQFEKLL